MRQLSWMASALLLILVGGASGQSNLNPRFEVASFLFPPHLAENLHYDFKGTRKSSRGGSEHIYDVLRCRRRTSGHDARLSARSRRRERYRGREAQRFQSGLPRRYRTSIHAGSAPRVGASAGFPEAAASGGHVRGCHSRRLPIPGGGLSASAGSLQIRSFHAAMGLPELPFGQSERITDL